MFPRGQEAQDALRGRSSLLPPRLPRLHSNPGDLDRLSGLDHHSNFDSRLHDDSLASAGTSQEHQQYRSLYDRSRGRSLEEENVNLRAMLPSMASLMSLTRLVRDHRSQRQEVPELLYERCRAQTLPQFQTHASSVSSVAIPTEPFSASSFSLRRELAPLTGLSAFADPQLAGMRSSQYTTSPSNRSSRWSPYTMPASRRIVNDPIASPWDDEENDGTRQNHRRRRTSPRRRLAESKARARAFQMAIEGEHTGRQGYFEDAGYRLHETSYEAAPRFAPPIGLSLPMALHPPSPLLVDESDTSPSRKNSRYLREMDRRAILARLDRGEKQSALAKEFRVTRAAICNLNKHRDIVLSRQHEDPWAKHPKKARRKPEAEGDTEPEDAEVALRDGSNRISRLQSIASPAHNGRSMVHAVALQPAERLITLLLSRETSDAAFRRYCDRLMTLVVEEVLAWTHTEVNKTQISAEPPTPCGICIAPGGFPMLSVFQTLEPELPTGHIKLSGSPELPPAVASHYFCLFYAFTDAAGGLRVAKSIQELLGRGAVEELLCLVTLAVSAFTVGELQRAHPSLRIAAAHVESQEDVDTWLQHNESLENDQNGSLNQLSRLELLASRAAEIY